MFKRSTISADLCTEAVNWYYRYRDGRVDAMSAQALVEFQEKIRRSWRWAAELLAIYVATDSGQRPLVDENRAGYLVFLVDGKQVCIPFFMMDMMPKGPDLATFVRLSSGVRVHDASVICLSGSTCQIGTIPSIGDVDYCEYVPTFTIATCGRLSQLAASSDSSVPLLVRFKVSNEEYWYPPWAANLLNSDPRKTLEEVRKSTHRQCIFVANVGSFGVLEVTNRLLLTRYSREVSAEPEAGGSFAYQEIPISPSSWTPNDLSDPVQLGRYLVFLHKQVEALIEESLTSSRSAIKAARRLISACRIIGLSSQVTELKDLLHEKGVLAALHDRCALYDSLCRARGLPLNALREKLKGDIHQMRLAIAAEGSRPPLGPYRKLSVAESKALQDFSSKLRPVLLRIQREVTSVLFPQVGGASDKLH